MRTMRIILSGTVQRVGMRLTVQRYAQSHGITGVAQNMSDGTVIIIAQGPEKRIDDFLKWASGGIPVGRHIHVLTSEMPTRRVFEDFKIV